MTISYETKQKQGLVCPWYLTLPVIVATFAVYFNALSNGFVHDDIFQIVGNDWIKDPRYLFKIFSNDVWNFQEGARSNYYRPLQHIIYMVNYHIFGLSPLGFHIVNILLHAAVSVLVLLISSKILNRAFAFASVPYLHPAFIASMLFATHPIHTEAVTWVAGSVELSFTLFYLLSFYLYIRSREEVRGSYVASAGSFFIAMLCKEPAVTLPTTLLAYDFAFTGMQKSFGYYLKRYLQFVILIGVYLLLRYHALGGFAPVRAHHKELTVYQYLINIFPLFAKYLEKLLFPVNLNFFYVLQPTRGIFETKAVLSLIGTVALLLIGYVVLKRDRAILVWLALLIIPLAPVLYIPWVGLNTFTERYLYLPSVGFVALVGLFVGWWRIRKPGMTLAVAIVLIAAVVLYSILTIQRNKIWKDEFSLWMDTVKKTPEVATIYPHTPLGYMLLNRGMVDEAIVQFELDLMLRPNLALGHYSLGVAYRKKGLLGKAIEQYRKAIEIDVEFADAHYNLANAYDELGSVDQAIEHYQLVLRLKPSMPEVHNNLGIAYAKKGRIDQAITQFEAAVKMDPQTPSFRNNLARARRTKALIDRPGEK